MAWLDDHPPRIKQFRCPRRAKVRGVIVVHTAESFADESPPDRGAENVAEFIRTRSNYGSYHDLVDSDSIINLVRYECEAYHDGTGSNPWSLGVSAACQAAKWNSYRMDWRHATVRNMAKAAARQARWVRSTTGIVVPARRITRAQSEAGQPGFISHGERDPARRTDPGKDFPWTLFLNTYAQEMGTIKPPPEDDDMPLSDEDIRKIWGYKNTSVDARDAFGILNAVEKATVPIDGQPEPRPWRQALGNSDILSYRANAAATKALAEVQAVRSDLAEIKALLEAKIPEDPAPPVNS